LFSPFSIEPARCLHHAESREVTHTVDQTEPITRRAVQQSRQFVIDRDRKIDQPPVEQCRLARVKRGGPCRDQRGRGPVDLRQEAGGVGEDAPVVSGGPVLL
jgi:hypothetical protein